MTKYANVLISDPSCKEIVDAIIGLLDPQASTSERWEAAQPLLEHLPDFGDSIKERMDRDKPILAYKLDDYSDSVFSEIYEAYSISSDPDLHADGSHVYGGRYWDAEDEYSLMDDDEKAHYFG